MRITVGKIVDVDCPVNLSELAPIDRIIYSAIDAFHKLPFYKRRLAQSKEREEEENRRIRETLLDGILSVVHLQIDMNHLLNSKNDKCKAILLEIKPRYVRFIDEVISVKDFSGYKIEHIKPNRDILKFNSNLSHLIYITQRSDL